MTPKEKAKEIVGKMCGNNCTEKNIKRIIPIALIAIDEMLKVISTGSYNETFYKEVREEIEKL